MGGEEMTNMSIPTNGTSSPSADAMVTSVPSGVTSVTKQRGNTENGLFPSVDKSLYDPVTMAVKSPMNMADETPRVVPAQNQLDAAFEKAMKTLKNRLNGVEPITMDGFKRGNPINTPTTFAPNIGVTPNNPSVPTNPKPQAVGGMVAQNAGVTMMKVRGTDTPSYTYGNTQVRLPNDINLNDDVAVQTVINENNAIIDMMDGGEDEEDFL